MKQTSELQDQCWRGGNQGALFGRDWTVVSDGSPSSLELGFSYRRGLTILSLNMIHLLESKNRMLVYAVDEAE
jgi:hypothetical protein